MRAFLFASITALLGLLCFSCKKPCQDYVFQYNGTDYFFPEKDSVQVGDTLYLSCVIKKSDLPDNLKQEENLGGNLIISDIDSFQSAHRGAVANFNFINIQGSLYTDPKLNPDNVKQIRFVQVDTSYNLLVGLVTLKSGSYVLTYTDVPGVHWSGSGKCGTANMYFDNINNNKHLYLFEDKFGPSSPRDSATSYCVRVN